MSGKPYPQIGKLAKFLKIPVIAARAKGSYSIEPKWWASRRKGSVLVEYELLLTKEQLKVLEREEIVRVIEKGIFHNDPEYMKENNLTFSSRRGAEYLERIINYCPECGSFSSMKSRGIAFSCESCLSSWSWIGDGSLINQQDNGDIWIHDWMSLERQALENRSAEKAQDLFGYRSPVHWAKGNCFRQRQWRIPSLSLR